MIFKTFISFMLPLYSKKIKTRKYWDGNQWIHVKIIRSLFCQTCIFVIHKGIRVEGKGVFAILLREPIGNKVFLNNALIAKVPPLVTNAASPQFPLFPYYKDYNILCERHIFSPPINNQKI